jgi:hypothetical protein
MNIRAPLRASKIVDTRARGNLAAASERRHHRGHDRAAREPHRTLGWHVQIHMAADDIVKEQAIEHGNSECARPPAVALSPAVAGLFFDPSRTRRWRRRRTCRTSAAVSA